MEMTWLETLDLLGIDLLAGAILLLVALDLVEQALHSAWAAAKSRLGMGAGRASARRPARIGAPHHV